jgi:hypothetical protein
MTTPMKWFVAMSVACAACSSATGPHDSAIPAYGVLLTATDSGMTSDGEVVRITIANQGTAPAFVRNCGGPALGVQVFTHGSWQFLTVPSIACIAGPPTTEIAAGASVSVRSLLSTRGYYRYVASVAATAQLTDELASTSNPVAYP